MMIALAMLSLGAYAEEIEEMLGNTLRKKGYGVWFN